MNATQAAFERLTMSRDFSRVNQEDLKQVALAVWHEGFVPTVTEKTVNKSAAGYVVDKLRRFSCVPESSKVELTHLAERLKASSGVAMTHVDYREKLAQAKRLDPLAKDWGLDSDLKQEVRSLMDFQRRNYRHHVR